MASTSRSSETSFAPASTIVMPPLCPATTRSNVLFAMSASSGFTTSSPLTQPMRTAPIGPSQGMSEIASASEAPLMPRMFAGFFWSTDMTVATTCTSFLIHSGKRERIERSIMRPLRIAVSEGRPSRFMNPPGTLPAE